MTARSAVLGMCSVLLAAGPLGAEAPRAVHRHESARLRRPLAAALSADRRILFVANARSGTLSLIDTDRREVLGEVPVGTRPSDLVLHPAGRYLLMTDRERHELVVFDAALPARRISNPSEGRQAHGDSGPVDDRNRTDGKSVLRRFSVARYPVSVSIDERGRHVHVASLWSRRVSLFEVPPPADGTDGTDGTDTVLDLQRGPVVRLPFAPRLQLPLPGGERLVVTDAFGGALAVINTRAGEIESVRELPAHNIRGLALAADGDRLLLSHQILNPLARTNRDDIHWGNLMQNVVRSVSLDAVRDPQADLLEESRLIRLGDVGRGAGDPAALAVDSSGRMVVALAGVGEVALFDPAADHGSRLSVGEHPVALVSDAETNRIHVLNRLSDSVSIIDGDAERVIATVPLGPQPQPSAPERGERLFFDARRSHDGWLSCHSCHPDGHTSGQLADTLSDGTFGTPKRILSLLGTRDNNPWAWDGRFRELHEQVSSSFTSTLQGGGVSLAQAADVVAFLHSLPFPPPVNEGEWSARERERIARGRRLFDGLGCRRCHVPPLTYTSDGVFDVGLSDESGTSKFNPPSLRGVSQRRGFFHDSRAKTLEEVLGDHDHQLGRDVSGEELDDLILFLNSL